MLTKNPELPKPIRYEVPNYLGVDYLLLNQYPRAIESFERSIQLAGGDSYPLPLYNLACVYSRMDQKEKALDYLKRAIAGGYKDYVAISKDPDLENIRHTPQYEKIVTELH